MKSIYVIGSLRNPEVPHVGNTLRAEGYDVFDDWFGGGEFADDHWQRYEQTRGRSYRDALRAPLAVNTFNLDYRHLNRCDAAVLVAPAGKSAHLELGYMIGQGKPTWYLFDKEPERWDVMTQFVYTTGGGVCFSLAELVRQVNAERAATEEENER